MKLKMLEYFITLAESRSINEAAQRLYIAQPSLTKALQLLEAEIGVSLFSRTKSGIVLTPEGETILPQARQMVEYYREWLSMAGKDQLHSMDIYVHVSLSGFLLPDVVLEFRKTNPDLVINCITVPSPENFFSRDTQKPILALTLCEEGGVCAELAKAQGNEPMLLYNGECSCLVSKHSHLARKASVSYQDLKDCYFVVPETDEVMRSFPSGMPILDAITDAVTPEHVIPVDSVGSVIDLLERRPETFALSYYPALNRYRGVRSQELTHRPFQSSNTKRDLCMFYSKRAFQIYPQMREFLKMVQESFSRFIEETQTH